MIYPWLSILDLQVLYSNVKKALECTEESSSDYTIIVPVFGDPSYLQNYEYLKEHKDKVVIASLLRQNAKMDAFIVKLMSEGFTVNAELESEQQNLPTKYYSLMKRTIETGVYDGLRRVSVRTVRTKYAVFLDGDSVPDGNIGRAIAVMDREGLDLASVRVIPSSERRLIEKMQAIEYKIAMRGRHFYPWLTSGACCIGRTTALREIMNTHSLYFSGGDAEIGIIAKEMEQKVGYINFTVLTSIPSTFGSWFKQRVNWFGGTFRLFVINFGKHLKSPLLLTYVLVFIFALLPIKLLEISQDWVVLPIVLLLYIPITFASWQVRNRYMLLFPLYSAFQSLVLPSFGVVKYLHSLIKYKRAGRIKVRKARAPTQVALDFRSFIEQLAVNGWSAKTRPSIRGQSGVEHEFAFGFWAPRDNPAKEKPYVIADVSTSTEAAGSIAVLAFSAKAMDVSASEKILIVMPRLNDEARALANNYGIAIVEAETAFEVIENAKSLVKRLIEQHETRKVEAGMLTRVWAEWVSQ